MVVFNFKTALGILIMFSSWTNFITGNPVGQELQQKQKEEQQDQPHHDNAVLEKFVSLIKNRIALGKDVAEYKWINGEAVLNEAQEKKVLESAKKTTEEMGYQYKPEDQLFFVNLMEATKFLEYVYISNWNGATKEVNTPQEKDMVDISVTREKISGMQKELITSMQNLKPLQNAKDCQTIVAKAIGDATNEDKLLTEALQRAFGEYCAVNISHKSK